MALPPPTLLVTRAFDEPRSISMRSVLRRPCSVRNSELGSREVGFELVRSRIEGPRARPTWSEGIIVSVIILSGFV